MTAEVVSTLGKMPVPAPVREHESYCPPSVVDSTTQLPASAVQDVSPPVVETAVWTPPTFHLDDIPAPRGKITLRPYQDEAVEAVFQAWESGVPCPSVVLPTGAGKSVAMGKIAYNLHHCPSVSGPVVIVAHRFELLHQLKRAVHQLDPTMTVGIVKAQDREYDADVVICSVQTLAASPTHIAAIGTPAAVIVDEAHHYAAETYQQVLANFGSFRATQWTPTVGFTATMWRSDGGLEKVWDHVVFERDLKWAIDQGFLIKPHAKIVVTDTVDLSKVRVVAGDFVQSELEDVMISSVSSTVTAMQTYAQGRASIVFAAGVDHARALAAELNDAGIAAGVIVGEMKSEERQDVYDRYRRGELAAMVTVTVLTEGADFPRCDCVVLARPTKSKSLHFQQIGRALRLYTDPDTGVEKTDALVLDLAGHSKQIPLASLKDLDDGFEISYGTAEGEDLDEEDLDAEDSAGAAPPPKQRYGILELEDFDLFSGEAVSAYRWLVTRYGTAFLPLGAMYVFLRFAEGFWHVGEVTRSGALQGRWVHVAADMEQAREFAERHAEALSTSQGGYIRRSKNQRKNIAPTDKQVEFATRLGIVNPASFTKARLSDEIEQVLATPRVDGRR